MTIHTYVEKQRGAGFKKPGNLYLVGGTSGVPACCKFPFLLSSCPCCRSSFRPNSGYTWINTDLFLFNNPAAVGCSASCIVNMPGTAIGLMWVPERFYPTVRDFEREAAAVGVAVRISSLQKDLQPGTVIALAHKKAVPEFNDSDNGNPAADLVTYRPGVFMFFKVEKFQYVVKPGDSDEALQKISARGIELITVVPEGEPIKLF